MATEKPLNGSTIQGSGFYPDGGEDVVAHFANPEQRRLRAWRKNQKVSFEATNGPKGKQATEPCSAAVILQPRQKSPAAVPGFFLPTLAAVKMRRRA